MRLLFLILLTLCVSSTSASARYVEALLRDKVAASSVIGIVRVRELISKNPPGRFCRSARVEVTTPIKGAAHGEVQTVDYDSDFMCDDVTYTPGEVCLVFLYRQPGGRLATFNYAYGKYAVTRGMVQRWTVKRYSHRDARLSGALSMIKATMAGEKTPA